MARRLLLALLVTTLAGCEANIFGTGPTPDPTKPGDPSKPDPTDPTGPTDPTDPTDPATCQQPAVTATPLFAPGPSETGPIVVKRPDGVIVTTAAGRVRPRHEREDRFMHFESHYFQHRSYKFTVEDHVANGQSSIKVIYEPVADPSEFGPTTNFRAWKVYGSAGNGPQNYTFADNGVLTMVAPRRLEKTITRNARDNREIRKGDIFDFEFGVFIMGFDGRDPSTIGDGAKSYYSDTFRYQVGTGGLSFETFDSTGLMGPVASARLGGDTTVPHIALADGTPIEPDMAFSQMALNMQSPHQQRWLEGRRIFHTDFGTGVHSEPYNPVFTEQMNKLGPKFNVNSCIACHTHNGRGTLPDVGGEVKSMVLKLNDDAQWGTQLQPQEAKLTLTSFETKSVALADGTTVTLQKPKFDANGREMKSSARIARQLVGMGLLEAIDEQTILARADEKDCDRNGISGRPQLVKDPVSGETRVGRFGWKAEKVSVKHQVADAADADLGVSSALFPEAAGSKELNDDDLDRLTVYMQLLGVLPQRDASSPKVQKGEQVFAAVGCAQCHAMNVTTGTSHPYEELRGQKIRPFSDLLLHDMGADLADDSGKAEASEWRTPPLWGVGYTKQTAGQVNLLHDGRARSVLEAVLWHGGEAAPVKAGFVSLSTEDREALISFVESL